LDLNLWCTQWKVNHGGTLSHTIALVGLLTVFHSQKEDELEPETNTKRQATQHDCLPSLLGGGHKGIKIVREEKNSFTGPTRAAKAEQKSLVPAPQAQEPNKEEPLSFVLFESPFTSVSTVSIGHHSLVFVVRTAGRLM
jgi:hypothetical protein